MAGRPPTGVVHLVRHAEAGARERFVGDDSLRPLTRRGRRQADAIARRLVGQQLTLCSSPALRCLETLAPLSAKLRRAISPVKELTEGAGPSVALRALGDLLAAGAATLVGCSHGDVMAGIVELAEERGASIVAPVHLEKAATTLLRFEEGDLTEVAFLAPPDDE